MRQIRPNRTSGHGMDGRACRKLKKKKNIWFADQSHYVFIRYCCHLFSKKSKYLFSKESLYVLTYYSQDCLSRFECHLAIVLLLVDLGHITKHRNPLSSPSHIDDLHDNV